MNVHVSRNERTNKHCAIREQAQVRDVVNRAVVAYAYMYLRQGQHSKGGAEGNESRTNEIVGRWEGLKRKDAHRRTEHPMTHIRSNRQRIT